MLIEENKSLKSYNTFGIDVSARYFVELNNTDDVQEIIQEKKFIGIEKLVLGGGSNILFTKNFDGLVLYNRIKSIETKDETENGIDLKAGAGEVWHQLVLKCIENQYAGIENLSLIPGLVGAAPMQNIGAYGIEIKDVFKELEAINLHSGELVKFSAPDCQFDYRDSVFKNKYKSQFLISSVTLALTKLNASKTNYRFKISYGDIKETLGQMKQYDLDLKAVSDAVIKIRTAKLPDPAQIGNAGSFFKNPVVDKEKYNALVRQFPVMPSYPQKNGDVKIPAGWLIEQCGWKGKVVGNTGSHKTQALVLVNYGHASGAEILQLANDIQNSVIEKFGIEIKAEVNVV